MTKTRLLWLSRYDPIPDQHTELERIFGDYEIITYSKPVNTAGEVISLMNDYLADEVFAILPFDMVEALVNNGVNPIRSQMHRTIHQGGEVEYVHDFFYKVTEISIKKEIL